MNLAIEDARLFFKLFFALLAYANRQLKVLPNVNTPDDIPKAGSQKVVTIRDALYAHPELLDQFVAENPEGFTPEELSIVASWKYRVSGDFYLMRCLEKYAVLMSADKPVHLYGVLGLYDPIAVLVRDQALPVLLRTTLLPFKGKIICDGLVSTYSITFGKGIRTDLDATYKRLKQKEGIIEQLVGPEGQPHKSTSLRPRMGKPAPDWKPAIDEIVAQVDKMRRADTPEQSAALGLLRAAVHLTQASFAQSNEVEANLKNVRRALSRLENVLFEEDYG